MLSSWFDSLLPELRHLARCEMDSATRARLAGTCKHGLAEDGSTWSFPSSWRYLITTQDESEGKESHRSSVGESARALMRLVKERGWADWPNVERIVHASALLGAPYNMYLIFSIKWPLHMRHSTRGGPGLQLNASVVLRLLEIPTRPPVWGRVLLPLPGFFTAEEEDERPVTPHAWFKRLWLHPTNTQPELPQSLMRAQCEAISRLLK
jgi:hypothetical protein